MSENKKKLTTKPKNTILTYSLQMQKSTNGKKCMSHYTKCLIMQTEITHRVFSRDFKTFSYHQVFRCCLT